MRKRKTKPQLTTRNSLEEKMLAQARSMKTRGTKVEYESEKLSYTVQRSYTPDLIITFPKGRKMYLEIKGYFRPEDRSKMLAVKRCNPDLDIRFVFPVDNKINKGSKTRYSDWCERHSFPYCIGPIPSRWFRQ